MEHEVKQNGTIISGDENGMTTVAHFIECLKMCDPNAIVVYASNEYDQNAPHKFISVEEFVALDSEGRPAFDPEDDELITVAAEDFEDRVIYPNAVTYVPCIKLFC